MEDQDRAPVEPRARLSELVDKAAEAERAGDGRMFAALVDAVHSIAGDTGRFEPARRAVTAITAAIPGTKASAFIRSRDGSTLFSVADSHDSAPGDVPVQWLERTMGALASDTSGPVASVAAGDLPEPWRANGVCWAAAAGLRTNGRLFGLLLLWGSDVPEPAGDGCAFLAGIASIAGLALSAARTLTTGHLPDPRATLAALIEAQENERARVSRELHDEANHSLMPLMLGLRLLARESQSVEAEERIEGLRRQVVDALHALNRVAHGLRPPALDNLGVGAALKELCETTSGQSGIEVSLYHVDENCPCRSPAIDVAIYRIVQEALTNVVRHADATKASVVLACRKGVVTVQIEDDGKGMAHSVAPAEGSPCLGIAGMQERAALLGGRVSVESSVGAGTSIYVEIPADYTPPEVDL